MVIREIYPISLYDLDDSMWVWDLLQSKKWNFIFLGADQIDSRRRGMTRKYFKRFVLLAIVVVLCIFSMSTAWCATYYVDFVGGADTNNGTSKSTPFKHIKGMTGCTNTCNSTTLTDGDIVFFKGGVTWTDSWPWTLVGGTSTGIIYTTDKTWYTGGSFTQPTFDDHGANPGGTGMANVTNAGYITLNDLKFVNCGVGGVANSNKCLVFANTHDIAITNSTFATESWISLYFVFTSAGSYSNFTWTGNDFSHTSGAVWFASAQANTSMHNITYNNNVFHDFASQIGGGVHGDGAWHGYVIPGSDSSQYMNNMVFCNNRFYGDFRRSFGTTGAMTALFFQEGANEGLTICNNDMSFTPVQASMFDGLIVLEGESNSKSSGVGIYNNSMASIGTNPMSAAIHISGNYKNITVMNNIASGMNYPVYLEDPTGSGATYTTDYNLWNGTSGQLVWGGSFQSYGTWKGEGRDTHSVLGSSPAWVSAPGNERLLPGSRAIMAGANLTNLGIRILNSDYVGVDRPIGSTAWDIGAYQFILGRIPNSPSVTILP